MFKNKNADFLRGFFNLSSTYKLDSDFFSTYFFTSQMIWKKNQKFNETKDYFSEKTEFAAAIISNCHSEKSMRLNLIKSLQMFLNVTIYGRCPTALPCPDNIDCKKYVTSKYKFYFAFENSVCEDYISEKFFSILIYNIIPVVYGRGKYDYFVSVLSI